MLRIHRNKFKHLTGLNYAGLAGSSAVFLLILVAMLFIPITSQQKASATDANSSISTYATTPTVGISLPSTIDFTNILPTPSGSTTTATANISITTTDSAGYSVFLYSANGDNSLKSTNPATTSSITATNTTATITNLTNNTWGPSQREPIHFMQQYQQTVLPPSKLKTLLLLTLLMILILLHSEPR